MTETLFYECKTTLCNRRKINEPCILVMPGSYFENPMPKNCPFIEKLDCDNAQWEQISRVTITRKY